MSPMYIKLTRMNGRPIWLNASFIVTIEPHERSGGSIVVPIGDGLDYEVKEPPATVLAMLDGAPVPAVVPVPTTDALDTAAAQDAPERISEAEDDSGKRTKTVKKTAKKPKAEPDEKIEAEADKGESSLKKKVATRSRKQKKTPLELSESELERLRKLSPKSLRKLSNTISSQFKPADAEKTITSLKEHDVIDLEGDHVIWKD